jgi:N-acetylglutamate synthase-like GNAT family acetyltransferase
MDITLLPYSISHEQDCADLIAVLPQWFGIPEANTSYLESMKKYSTWVALNEDKVVGVITLTEQFQSSFEILFLAVHPDYHRKGIGKLLIKQVEEVSQQQGGRWLHVKTLSPSHPDPFYGLTREFYYALGFSSLFESDTIWGAANPAIILVKQI